MSLHIFLSNNIYVCMKCYFVRTFFPGAFVVLKRDVSRSSEEEKCDLSLQFLVNYSVRDLLANMHLEPVDEFSLKH